MNNKTLKRMRQMCMYGIDAFKNSLETILRETLSTDELASPSSFATRLSAWRRFVRDLIDSEWDDRLNRNIARLTRTANFRYKASLEGIDYSIERGLDRNRRTKRGQRLQAASAPARRRKTKLIR